MIQRFVNTTPNPRATKKSNGDEPCPFPFPFPLPLLLPLPPSVGTGDGLAVDVRSGEVDEARVGSGEGNDVAEAMALVVACLIWCCRLRTASFANSAI